MAYEDSKKVAIGANDVAVGLTHGLFGSHLGVAYCAKDGAPKLLHLANHRRLEIEPYAQSNWIASVVPFDPLEAIQFIALVRNYAKLHPGKDGPYYGISLLAGRGSLDGQGNYSPSDPSAGFTCASLIAEIFNASGFELVDLQEWKPNEDNRIWGKAVVCMLQASKATPEHVQAVERSIDGLRLLPEEVAAAAELASEDWPTNQTSLEKRATELTAEILLHCGEPIEVPHDSPYAACVKIYEQTGRSGATVGAPPPQPPGSMVLVGERREVGTVQFAQRGIAAAPKVGRNDPCPCASGRKFKHCHGAKA